MRVEKELKENGSDVVYFPYTNTTSSTLLIQALERLAEGSTKA